MTFVTIKTNDNDPSCHDETGFEQFTIVLKKFAVDKMIFDSVLDSFNDIRPCLLEGIEYTAEDLIGFELWADWTYFAQRLAYLSLKHIAALPDSGLIDMASEDSSKITFQISK